MSISEKYDVLIKEAVAAERERCARIVESYGWGGERYDYDGSSPYEIAQTVRESKEEK